MKCKICDSVIAHVFDTAKVLEKYEVSYYQCGQCGFIQTEEPYWLAEAYSDAIGFRDIGLAGRNLIQMELTKTLIVLFFDQERQYLDYGGGYGLFVRLMRDRGYDFYLYEPNCENLFARTFDINLPTGMKFHVLTAFEVFEHLVDPLAEIEQMFKLSTNIFFSTTLLPKTAPRPSRWWYYGLEGGQHISIFSRRSLDYLANRLGKYIYSDGHSYHLLTDKRISSSFYMLAMRLKISRAINCFFRRPSLLSSDYMKVTGKPLE